MTRKDKPRQDLYSRVTDKIITDLEQGVRPWLKPWNAEHAVGRITKPLRHNGQPYNGINILMLWSAAMEKEHTAPIWMTFRQAKELGANVRKGEKGELVVYANKITRMEETSGGEEIEHTIPFMKGYTVFNVEQIEGLPSHYYQLAEPVLDPVQRIDHAEAFFAATGADIRHGGNQAYYGIGSDRIQLPPFESFRDAESYYATLAHEAIHWTRHNNYLRRGWHKLMEEAGFVEEVVENGKPVLVKKYTPYALRHFFASMLIKQNKSLKYVQTVMGHEDIKMTFDVYGHVIQEREAKLSSEAGGILPAVLGISCGDSVAPVS